MKKLLIAPTNLTGPEALCISAVGNIILFIIVIAVGFPVFHSMDDLNIAWILGDGFGTGASTCLPFLHNQHYWISAPVQWLFHQYPGVNWFSWSMIITEFASMTAICFVLLRVQRWQFAAIHYLVLFMVYGSFLLYYLHDSSTATTAVTAGLLLTWYAFSAPKSKAALIAAALFLIAGTLFRLHIAFPLLVVAAPFFLLLKGYRKKWMAAAFLAGCLLVSFMSFWWQEKHYSGTCSNWQSEEKYRQAKYSNINYHRNTTAASLTHYREESAMLDAFILPDTSFVPATTLLTIADESRSVMPLREFFSWQTWKWPLINNRLFIIAAVLALCFSAGNSVRCLISSLSFLAVLAVLFYLLLVMKLPEFMIPALFFTFFTFTAASSVYGYPATLRWKIIALVLAGALVLWGMIRTWKTGHHNRMNFDSFRQVHAELAAHPDKLFVSIGHNEPFFYVHVFATPKKFSFRNILFVDQPLSLRNPALLRDFGYTGFVNAFNNPAVYFHGPELPELIQYMEKKRAAKYAFGTPLPTFKYSRIWKPMPVDLVIPASK